ncbi:DNA-binding transcriptional regulator, LysR family [Andreprevotia lacus DSM 23236]|jgi:DNA-binding transcriptional LysR family regulator|uniref:DNA-binding transcriptional regulator, LysR family n=1 Tax=Andreprevotia lacus DSM 23236 TaxID=1121001 RepID=A0A1W1X182_9NEIS|nr:LysR family transcriptional regulator [Andreprevotia lacus]SMC17665.1 DNA-binding transcriptional regulator, LysR family [Andreprevotia lacus DSM 23236]
MALPDLNRLELFIAVYEAGGFSAAADRLGVAKSLVSQQVARLEAELGVALFTRSTRRVAPTEAGEALYRDCTPLLAALGQVVARAGETRAALEGRLRLTAPVDYACGALGPWLAEFALLHPALEVEVIVSDHVLDMVGEGLDLAIRMGALHDSSLHALKLGDFAQLPIAAPALLDRHAPLQQPSDLATLPWVVLSQLKSPLNWSFTAGSEQAHVRMRPVMRANSASLVLHMVRAGVGASVLPDFMVADALAAGQLIQLLPAWSLPKGGIYAVYPAAQYLPAKVRALIDFLRPKVAG